MEGRAAVTRCRRARRRLVPVAVGLALSFAARPAAGAGAPSEATSPPAAPPAAHAPLPGWPRWIESADGRATQQTSGLAFVGRRDDGSAVFLAADDEGALWRLTVGEPDGTIRLDPIPFTGAAGESLARFPKKDLEGIAYCPTTMRVLVSIEGNAPRDGAPRDRVPGDGRRARDESAERDDFREWLGVFVAILDRSDPLDASRVIGLERLPLAHWAEASRPATKNRGFEGIAVREDTLLLGLEGLLVGEDGFADSTMIDVFDLGARTFRAFSTRPLGLVSVTGLDVGRAGRWYGIDRNQATLFSFRIGESGIADFQSVPLALLGVRGVPYSLPCAESIALDDSGAIWIAIDPWIYEPTTRAGLTAHDVKNYAAKVPMLYKFEDPFREGPID